MFYAISKRRRDINAAEDRGREEGIEEGRMATLDDLAARLKDNPEAIAVIAELRAQCPDCRRR